MKEKLPPQESEFWKKNYASTFATKSAASFN